MNTDHTPNEITEARQRALAAALEVRPARSVHSTDGRTVVADALSDGLTPAFLHDLTIMLHHGVETGANADRLIGELVREHVCSYVEGARIFELRVTDQLEVAA